MHTVVRQAYSVRVQWVQCLQYVRCVHCFKQVQGVLFAKWVQCTQYEGVLSYLSSDHAPSKLFSCVILVRVRPASRSSATVAEKQINRLEK